MNVESPVSLPVEGPRGAPAEPFGLWGRAFRPFFLGAAVYAALAVPFWAAVWLGSAPAPGWLLPAWWHGHEMVFGLVGAAVAGFLLTASPVWTGGPALTGRLLALLFALWVAGRLAMAAAGRVPTWLVAALDVALLPAVALAVLRTLRGSGQLRNYGVVGIVTLLTAANAAMHAEALGIVSGVAGRALRFAVDAIVVLLLVIGGRITPAFTQNALRRAGLEIEVRRRPGSGGLAIAAASALAVAGLVGGRSVVTGALALVAGIAAAARLGGWRSWHSRKDPLVWSLHAGALWLVVGLLLVGASDLGASLPASAGLHALTAGAMGATILAVMTRVGLGHTGRSLELPAGVLWCYVLVHSGAAVRVAAPLASGAAQSALLSTSGLVWAAAFGIFAVRYWPILTTPRPDGRPG